MQEPSVMLGFLVLMCISTFSVVKVVLLSPLMMTSHLVYALLSITANLLVTLLVLIFA